MSYSSLDDHTTRLLIADEQYRVNEWAGRINDNRREYAYLFDDDSFIASRRLLVRIVTCCGHDGVLFALALMFCQRSSILDIAFKQRTMEILRGGV